MPSTHGIQALASYALMYNVSHKVGAKSATTFVFWPNLKQWEVFEVPIHSRTTKANLTFFCSKILALTMISLFKDQLLFSVISSQTYVNVWTPYTAESILFSKAKYHLPLSSDSIHFPLSIRLLMAVVHLIIETLGSIYHSSYLSREQSTQSKVSNTIQMYYS